MVLIDGRKSPEVARFRWKFSALGRRVVLMMLLTAHFFAGVATILQVLSESRRHETRTAATLDHIRNDLVPAFADQLPPNALSAVIATVPGIDAVTFTNAPQQHTQPFDLSISRSDGAFFIKTVPFRLRSIAWDLFAANLLHTVVTGMIMLIIFDRIAARHLRQIADQVRSIHWMDADSPIKLEKDAGIFPEEIDSIVDALENMRRQSLQAYDSVSFQAAELRALNSSMRTANREQAELTYALSHDLIAPVNTLDMLLGEIAEFPAGMPDATLEVIGDMRTSTKRMRAHVEAVQNYARLLQEDINNDVVKLDDIVRDILEELRDDIHAANAQVHTEKLGDVIGDAVGFRQVFLELLRNAIFYRDPERPLSITISNDTDPSDTETNIQISDTGLGIEPLYQDTVFGLFRRLHTYADIPGNGMGLPLSQRIMHRHKGTLLMNSTAGSGTTVKLSFLRTPT